jgi:EAL domain-containing protein (putative c-di-GMP-specific phosphodiesterase class I)
MLAVRAVLSRPLTPEQTQFEFQPVVPLAGKLTGQFQLGFKVRSTQHAGVAVAYADLAPVAAECGQLGTLDRWLLERSLSVREDQLKRGRQLRLFVPQSVASLLDPDIPVWLANELKQRHLSGTGLTIELPCSELIDGGARAAERLKFLHQNGVRVCLVDFGRDWAAVHALKNLTVDFVRLSPALVEDIGTAKTVGDTLLALIRKAHASGCAVIAPEVDSNNRAHVLLRMGVDYAVGPAFARPSPEPEFDFARPLW